MVKTLLLDSSVYIASLNKQDIFYRQTRELSLKLKNKDLEIVTPILVILEVANILKKPAAEILSLFEGSVIIDFDLAFAKTVIPFFKKINLKTADALIASSAKIYKAELLSWDKKLVSESRKIVSACTPAEYLEKEFNKGKFASSAPKNF